MNFAIMPKTGIKGWERTVALRQSLVTLQNTQAQLVQPKNGEPWELTAGIAHEIQNPLNFVNNFSEVSAEMMNELKNAWKPASRQMLCSGR